MHPDIEVIEMNSDPRTGKPCVVVRLDGETLGIYGSLEQARKYFGNPVNARALKKKLLPGMVCGTRLVRSFGKMRKHAVLAVIDADGEVLYHIVVTPGNVYPGSYALDAALELAGTLATEYDASPDKTPNPRD
ncbi:hypothetical protein QA646_05725 [Rhizobium sp. CB3090]|uniref:hypothetical protein n=1 Tax=Rhizobium sp. CB3090 TaxID=3039156 RepID=UPI0024B08DAC|nr:hypothetical protein [Rhizobium sp. CB3090]WFU10357.1 hypothetical protein QA646_05725 [Rhizobium sp. CB3090]